MTFDLEIISKAPALTVEQGRFLIDSLMNQPDSWRIICDDNPKRPSKTAARKIVKVMNSRGIELDEYDAVVNQIIVEVGPKLGQCKEPEKFWGFFGRVVSTTFCYKKKRKNEQHPMPNKTLGEFVRSKGATEIDDRIRDDSDNVLYDMVYKEQIALQKKIFMQLNDLDTEILVRKYMEDEPSRSIAQDLYKRRLITSRYSPPSEEWLNNITHTVDQRAARARQWCKNMEKQYL